MDKSGHDNSVSWLNFLDWRARTTTFRGLASSRHELLMLTGVDRPQRLEARRVTGNFLDVLGVVPVLGRGFVADDDRAGAEPVVVVSDGFWRAQLGANAAAIGARLTLNGQPHRVVGVLPPSFRYLGSYALFVSMGPHVNLLYSRTRADHAGHYVVGRLKDGVTIEAARAELRRIAGDLEREYPDSNAGLSAGVQPLASRAVADVRPTLLVLMGAVGCLLILACANVANLLIARGAARQHELSVRAALGGGRARIAAQLLIESTLLSAAGGIAGLFAASSLLSGLVAVAPAGTPRLDEVRLDTTAVAFALTATAICGLVFGAFPAFQASATSGQETVVRVRPGGASAQSHRLRRGLMILEIAIALVLLAGAGLMGRTLRQLTRVETGFAPDHLLTLRASFNGPQWPAWRRRAFFDRVRRDLMALPGIRSAGLVSRLPIDGSDWNSPFVASDKPTPRNATPFAAFTLPTTGYFEAIGTPLVRGRTFHDGDTAESTPIVIINESLARQTWPGENPIGKQLKQGFPEQPKPWREVVGVVADVKYNGIAEPTPLQIYIPATQETPRDLAIVVRTSGPPATLADAVERAIHALDKDVPIYSVRTMENVLTESMSQERMALIVLGLFASVAVALAAIGLYGVVSHAVTERTHEIGVRMALGATARQVVQLVVRQGLVTTSLGLAIGIAAAIALSRFIAGLLFGVEPTDPMTFAAVVTTLFAVAAIACYVPAWRATRVDPTTALRAE